MPDRYTVDLLAPRNAIEAPGPEDERGPLPTDESDTVEEGFTEGELPGFGVVDLGAASTKKSMIPSSIGLSFAVISEPEALKIRVGTPRFIGREQLKSAVRIGNP